MVFRTSILSGFWSIHRLRKLFLVRTCRDLAAKGHPLVNNPIEAKPISLDPFTPHMGEDGCLIAWMEDPDGHFIEVMQLSGRSLQEQFEKANPITE